MSGGKTGVFVLERGVPVCVTVLEGVFRGRVVSHPDVNAAGDVCWYEMAGPGAKVVMVGGVGRQAEIAGGGAGELGPTISEDGRVAYRWREEGRAEEVRCWSKRDGVVCVCRSEERGLAGFEGLPVVSGGTMVVVRGRTADGGGVIARVSEGGWFEIARSGGRLLELGRFPAVDGMGRCVFAGVDRERGAGVHLWNGSDVVEVVAGGERFESVRGALAADDGHIVFMATRRGGDLGIYEKEGAEPLLEIGRAIAGAEEFGAVTEFALNPVSLNGRGDFAVRVGFEGSVEAIVDAVRV